MNIKQCIKETLNYISDTLHNEEVSAPDSSNSIVGVHKSRLKWATNETCCTCTELGNVRIQFSPGMTCT